MRAREVSGRDGTESALHRAEPRAKLVALIVFAVVVVATPREWFAAYALYAVVVITALTVARARPLAVLRRLSVEIPFVVFAALLPFVATGPRVEVWGLDFSVAGLWAAWAMLAKATLATLAAIALVTTTPPRRIVNALEQLWLPRQLTSIMVFMLRYLDVIVEEQRRMRVARAARGFVVRGPREWRVLATSLAALFIRSHGRGERVHLAMLARGYDESARDPASANVPSAPTSVPTR